MEDAHIPVPEPAGDLTPPPIEPPTAVGAGTPEPAPEPEPRSTSVSHQRSVRLADVPVEIVRAVDRVLDVLDQVGDFIAGRPT
jgi:hypothetical protein